MRAADMENFLRQYLAQNPAPEQGLRGPEQPYGNPTSPPDQFSAQMESGGGPGMFANEPAPNIPQSPGPFGMSGDTADALAQALAGFQMPQLGPRSSTGQRAIASFLGGAAQGFSKVRGADMAQRGESQKIALQDRENRRKEQFAAASEAARALRAHRETLRRERAAGQKTTEANAEWTRREDVGFAHDKTLAGIRSSTTSGSTVTKDDADAIADAIISGKQPPTLTGLYRNAGPVKAALARKGYDQTVALMDWDATKRFLSSKNSPPQLRLRQAIDATYNSLDLIDALSDELSTKVPRSDIRLLAKGINIGARELNAMGPEAQTAIRRLQTEIQNVNTEMAVVYQGGNSPTDHSMQQAEKNLNVDFGPQALKGNTKLLRQNLRIRANSIATANVLSPSNPVVEGGGNSINIGNRSIPVGGSKITVLDPKGKPQDFDTQAQADAFLRMVAAAQKKAK